MHSFDYTFLVNGSVPMRLLNTATAIGELRVQGKHRSERYPALMEPLEAIARVQSIKTSNAIEGIITTDERIAELASGTTAPLDHDEQEITGYRDALDYIHRYYRELVVSERTAIELHRMILSYVPNAKIGYKTTDNVIADRDESGKYHVRFRPTSALDTPEDMEQLMLAYAIAHDDARVNKLLLIACFILDFLCIHPFSDGNGRVSRLLSLLLLYQEGYDVGKYVSFEKQINDHKAWYYESLRESSQGWQENQSDYTPFMENFLAMLLGCYQEFDSRFLLVGDRPATKRERVEHAVQESFFPLAKKDLIKLLPDISPSTIESVLGALVKEGKAKKVGTFRNARYVPANDSR